MGLLFRFRGGLLQGKKDTPFLFWTCDPILGTLAKEKERLGISRGS